VWIFGMEGKNIPIKFPDDETPQAEGSQADDDVSRRNTGDLPNGLVGEGRELIVTEPIRTDKSGGQADAAPPVQGESPADPKVLKSTAPVKPPPVGPAPISNPPAGGTGKPRVNGSAENTTESPAGVDPKRSEESAEEMSLILAQGQALEEAQSQIEILTAERSNLYDQILRRQAEFENFRKRSERDKAEFFQRLRSEVLLELLPVLDNFERALISVEGGALDAKALQTGVELIHKQLKDALTKMGLQQVETLGATFDPNLHEAITVEATDQHKENTIMEEFERGYKLGDRLLRPAKVKVAALPPR
jgi:molecular chaperone GrpE